MRERIRPRWTGGGAGQRGSPLASSLLASHAQLGEYPGINLPDGRAEFALGDLVSEEERVACFALEVLPLPLMEGKPVASLEGEQLLELEIAFDELAADRVASRTVTQVLRVQATQEPAQVVLNSTVATWVATQKVGSVMKGVSQRMNEGRRDEALRLLEEALASLRTYGGDPQSLAEVWRALDALKQQIAEGWSSRSSKEALLPSSRHLRMSSRFGREPRARPPSSPNPPPAPAQGPPTPPAPSSTSPPLPPPNGPSNPPTA